MRTYLRYRAGFAVVAAAALGTQSGAQENEKDLTQAIEALGEGDETVVVPRELPIEGLSPALHGRAVRTTGTLQDIHGDRVLILTASPESSGELALVILTDPSDSSQQATYRVGDIITATGILTGYDETRIEEIVDGGLENLNLSAFAGVPTILTTSLQSQAPPEAPPDRPRASLPSSSRNARNAEPAAPATPVPSSAAELQTSAAEPQPPAAEPRSPPVASPPPAIVAPEGPPPSSEAEYLANPEVLLDQPAPYLERLVVFDATLDRTVGERSVRLDFVEGQDEPEIGAILLEAYPLIDDGTRVRVTGHLTTLSFEAIEIRVGILLEELLLLEREPDEPVFLVTDLTVLQPEEEISE